MDRVTIVTVCYNAEKEIENTMRSVCIQDYPSIEYLIVDGMSSDKTVEIANNIKREYRELSNINVSILSEKDNGIYDAMNKGIRKATGEWLLFLNAGDLLDSKATLSNVFKKNYTPDISGIYGDTLRYSGDWSKKIEGHPLESIADELPLPFCHQSVFVRKTLMQEMCFDTKYELASDYDFFVKCYKKGCKFVHVGEVVSRYAMGGISECQTVKHLEEKIQIREKNGLEIYTSIKKRHLLYRLRIRQAIKKYLPKRIVKMIRGY